MTHNRVKMNDNLEEALQCLEAVARTPDLGMEPEQIAALQVQLGIGYALVAVAEALRAFPDVYLRRGGMVRSRGEHDD